MKMDGVSGQISIFDLLPKGDFTQMTLPEIADEISKAIGHTFIEDKRKGWEGYWYFKYRGYRFEIMRSKYEEGCVPATNHTADGSFIGVSVMDGHGGAGSPADSIDEAIEFFKKQMSRHSL